MANLGAYVTIETQVGKTRDVLDKLIGLSGIVSASQVTGDIDIIATISNGKDPHEIGEIVNDSQSGIHSILGVVRTNTHIILA